MLNAMASPIDAPVLGKFVNWLPSTAGNLADPSSWTTLFAEVPTAFVDAVPRPEIFVLAIVPIPKVILPEVVIGDPDIVNSDPACAMPTWVTVPPEEGVTWVYNIAATPIVPESVVHKKNLSAFVDPSFIIFIWPASSSTVSKSGSLEAVPEATTL